MKRVRQFILFSFLVLATFPFAVLPYRLSLRVGDLLGMLIYLLWKSRRAIAIDNLRAAIERGAITLSEDPRAVIRRNFRNLGRFVVEVNKIYYGFAAPLFRTVELTGVENFRKAQKKGKGIMFITGHCGNWELMAAYLSMNVDRASIIARKQNNEYIDRFIVRTREKYGNRIIYKKGALKQLLISLKKNESVALLVDQSVVKSEGIIIHFLGKNAYAMKTPAVIARKTGAAVLPLFIRRTEQGHHIEIQEEIPLVATDDNDTALLLDTINFSKPVEEYIKKYPSDWLWIHRRWKKITE
ncbi:MAG: lysophospholipid acyltransferase family protein [Nitrospirae bacterium]|nr:lysophospholipid acyltransferase family protein [Nitrospirota bacterium]